MDHLPIQIPKMLFMPKKKFFPLSNAFSIVLYLSRWTLGAYTVDCHNGAKSEGIVPLATWCHTTLTTQPLRSKVAHLSWVKGGIFV